MRAHRALARHGAPVLASCLSSCRHVDTVSHSTVQCPHVGYTVEMKFPRGTAWHICASVRLCFFSLCLPSLQAHKLQVLRCLWSIGCSGEQRSPARGGFRAHTLTPTGRRVLVYCFIAAMLNHPFLLFLPLLARAMRRTFFFSLRGIASRCRL